MSSNGAPVSVSLFRLAGLAYLVIILAGVSAEALLRGPLIDYSDAAATANSLRENSAQFRLSIAADLAMALFDALLAILLFLIFRGISFSLALAALVFRLIQTVVIAVNLLSLQAAWLLAAGDASTSEPANILLLLEMHRHGYDLGLAFFAVNCFLTGLLVIRSALFPRLLGIGLAASGIVYLAGSVSRFFAPALLPAVQPAYVVPLVVESAFCAWLLLARFPDRSPGAKPA